MDKHVNIYGFGYLLVMFWLSMEPFYNIIYILHIIVTMEMTINKSMAADGINCSLQFKL